VPTHPRVSAALDLACGVGVFGLNEGSGALFLVLRRSR